MQFLALVKLTGWIDPRLDSKILDSIYKQEPELTHHICCIYKKENSQEVKSLFNFQIKINDINAKTLGLFLTKVMIKSEAKDINYLLEERMSKFWKEISQIKLLSLDRSATLV